MKKFWSWLIKNIFNLFSIVGLGLTLYLGVFYVPDWVKNAQNEKQKNAQENLIQSIKELVYSDSTCTLSEIKTLYEAKEIEIQQVYPQSLKQVLICVQESFMEDKYLPLYNRKVLIKEVEVLKSDLDSVKIHSRIEFTNKSENKISIGLLSAISVILSIFIVFIGIISYYLKFRSEKEKQEEIDNQINQAEFSNIFRDTAYDFEKGIHSILNSYKGVKIMADFETPFHEFDLEFKYEGKNYFVEIKFLTKSKVGLNSLEKFISSIKSHDGIFWFVYNTDLTELVKRRVEDFNSNSSDKQIVLIKAAKISDFKNELEKFLHIISPNPQSI